MLISIIMRLRSDGSATSLRLKFVVSLSFSEKQMEGGKTKKPLDFLMKIPQRFALGTSVK